jgi:Fe-S-cluster-containing dehydrogenase component
MDGLRGNAAMTTYGMVIDVDRCTGCHLCFLACRDEHVGNDNRPIALGQPDAGQKWIDVTEHERGALPRVKVDYVPLLCLQCADAPCIEAATGGAVTRRPDGIVVIDPDKAVDQHDIVGACPYRMISWNAATRVAQKCTFCAHLLDQGWKEPRCVEACPTKAMVFGDLADSSSEIARLRAARPVEDIHPEFATRPAVGYLGLPKRFVAGEIAFADRLDTPAEGVEVVLRHDGERRATRTDNYGEFEFNGLGARASCVLTIEHPGYLRRELALSGRADLDVGTIVLEPLPGRPA